MSDNYNATIHDKRIHIYSSKSQRTESDVALFLKGFNRERLLLQIAKCSKETESRDNYTYHGIPITNQILNLAVYLIVKYCQSRTNLLAEPRQIRDLFDDCHYILDQQLDLDANNVDPLALFMRMSYKQFLSQDTLFNGITRTLFMYFELWQEAVDLKTLNVQNAITETLGLSLDKLYIFVFLTYANKDGYIQLYDQNVINELTQEFGIIFTVDDHKKFLNFVSRTYSEQGLITDSDMVAIKYPLIDTEKNTSTSNSPYIIVSYFNLFNKLVNGVYYALSDSYKDDANGNLFKSSFGAVFELYVGKLLNYHFAKWQVYPEFEYSKKKLKTVDWFVRRGKRLIAFEVKQSSIYLGAKQSLDMQAYKDDIKKTILKAVKQLEKTKKAILSQEFPTLSKFKHVTEFEFVIVLWDSLPNANNIMKKIIQDEYPQLSIKFHIINIEELEYFLSEQQSKENMFDLLSSKHKKDSELDFKEYLLKIYGDRRQPQRFLIQLNKQYKPANLAKKVASLT